jgi:hypothetical protein
VKYKTRIKPKHNYLLIGLIDDKSLKRLNKIFGTHYTRENVKNRIRVIRKEKGFKFWDKPMRQGSRSKI